MITIIFNLNAICSIYDEKSITIIPGAKSHWLVQEKHPYSLLFDLRKSAAEAHQVLIESYSHAIPIIGLKVNDKEGPGGLKNFDDNNLQDLVAENCSWDSKGTFEQLSG